MKFIHSTCPRGLMSVFHVHDIDIADFEVVKQKEISQIKLEALCSAELTFGPQWSCPISFADEGKHTRN